MIVVVYGLPGTGKTHFSRRLGPEINAIHLNTDIIREELGKKGSYGEKSKQEVYDHMLEKTEKELDQGHNILLDGTFHKKERREKIRDLARKTGNDIFFIEIRAPEKIVAGRLEKKRKHSEADYEVYRKLEKESDFMKEDHLVLVSGTESLYRMIIKAKNYIYGYPANRCPGK